jgi:PAS domain S-box-containing protein
MAQRTDQTWERLNAELEALRERVAELEAAADEREERIETIDWRAFESRAALMALSTVEEGRFIEVNEVYLETLGFRREEVIGKTSIELGILEPGERDALREAAAEKGFARNVPVTVRTKGGDLRHGLFSADIVRRKDQVCWFTVVVDTTTQKQAEEALLENEAKWRSILENAPGIIVTADRDGTVTFVSRTVSGVSPERVVGTSVFEYVLPEHRQTLQDAFERALEAGETVTYELIGGQPGSAVPFESRVGPLRRDGRTVGVTIVSSDIRERKRAEEERRKLEATMLNTQRLESLGVLTGGIAHDFNNLLVAILGNADLALMDMAPHAPYRGWVEQIKLAARRASELTNQMLIYSGRGAHAAEPPDLNVLVAEIGDLLRVSISNKVVLNCERADEVLLVDADASQIHQVVMNLVINASEAIGDEQGTVTIRIGEVDVGEEIASPIVVGEDLPEGRCVSLEVADTGCGIEAAARSQLFDPFYTTKSAGRGLGLAAVLGIVRAHRGAIEVRSQVNQGSTFRILLPAVESSVAEHSEDRGPQGQDLPGGGTILVVDDEEGVRDVAKGMLEREGFRVITAEDGREAVRIFRTVSAEIDAVLLDLSMPHMDGGEALREMRRLRADVKAILCSGYLEDRARGLCDGPGQASFLRKPYDSETLLGTLREVLASEVRRESKDRSTDG